MLALTVVDTKEVVEFLHELTECVTEYGNWSFEAVNGAANAIANLALIIYGSKLLSPWIPDVESYLDTVLPESLKGSFYGYLNQQMSYTITPALLAKSLTIFEKPLTFLLNKIMRCAGLDEALRNLFLRIEHSKSPSAELRRVTYLELKGLVATFCEFKMRNGGFNPERMNDVRAFIDYLNHDPSKSAAKEAIIKLGAKTRRSQLYLPSEPHHQMRTRSKRMDVDDSTEDRNPQPTKRARAAINK
jgi:hypothetical protein